MTDLRVNSIGPASGSTVTVSGFATNNDVTAWGAIGNGIADDTSAINAAITWAHSQGPGGAGRIGSIINFPPGLYSVTSKIIVPEGVTLRGYGRVMSIIQAHPTLFPTSTAVVQLGNPPTETLTFGSRLEDMAIDCNSVTGSVGVASTNINELSALENCEIYNYMDAGVRITTSAAQNYTMRDLYLICAPGAVGAYGVDINGGASPFRGIDGLTVDSFGGNHTAGIRLNNTAGFLLSRVHVENSTNGILIGDTTLCTCFSIHGVTGSTPMTTVVNITAAQSFIIGGVTILSGATNAIVDTPRGVTITDTQTGPYMVGNGSNNPSINLSDASQSLNTMRVVWAKDNLLVGAPGQNLGISRILHGTGTLVAGSKVMNTSPATLVTANSRIILTSNTDGGTPGWLRVSARTAGTSFTVTSSSGTDTSTFAYWMFEP